MGLGLQRHNRINIYQKPTSLEQVITAEKRSEPSHLVSEVDIQASHIDLTPHGCRFGFLPFKIQNPL